MQERNEVSIQEVQVYHALATHKQWLTNKEIAKLSGVASERTVRFQTRKLVQLGLIDIAEVFPGHRFKWSEKGEKRNQAYALRLQKAGEVFGVA
jgi:hypothetical protein